MEAAAEQDGAVCVCAENQREKKTLTRVFAQLYGHGGAPIGGLRSLKVL